MLISFILYAENDNTVDTVTVISIKDVHTETLLSQDFYPTVQLFMTSVMLWA